MSYDDDRVELIAIAILRAVRELIDTGGELTIEATLARLEAHRLAATDKDKADICRDAILIIRNGKV